METIEEAARNYSWELRRKIKDITGIISEQSFHTFIDAVAWAERWIPVEEEMPDEDVYVLTKRKREDGHEYVIFNKTLNSKWVWQSPDTSVTTHWRPVEHK